jgi:DNA-binding NtrC family response regulator
VALRIVGTGAEVPLPEGIDRFTIGSDEANDLVLEDEYVSKLHCVLERHGGREWIVRDRKSRNGTYVDGVKVSESQVVTGSRLVIGGVALTLVGAGPRTPQALLDGLVGDAPGLRAAVDMAMRAARSSAPTLILGESGTGKELFARLIHFASARAPGPFVPVNCGAIAQTLGESELFGHERGAFTGASERRRGLFEQADGGTIFLDEIGELPQKQQSLLLRVLEARRVRRVGGAGENEVDVRVVAATHRDLGELSTAGAFRHDLYHRLATVEIRVPALRERPGDIPLLARHFLDELTPELGARTIDDETMAELMRHSWPGNVRELRNAIHRAAAMGDGPLRLEDMVPARARYKAVGRHAAGTTPPPPGGKDPLPPLGPTTLHLAEELGLEDMIKAEMARALARCGTQRRAAQYLGMARSTFHERAHRYGLLRRGGGGAAADDAGDDDGER